MNRKKGVLIPIEYDLLDVFKQFKIQGVDELYGFQIHDNLERKSHRPYPLNVVGFGTLYRALDRLGNMGYLTSRWEEINTSQ